MMIAIVLTRDEVKLLKEGDENIKRDVLRLHTQLGMSCTIVGPDDKGILSDINLPSERSLSPTDRSG